MTECLEITVPVPTPTSAIGVRVSLERLRFARCDKAIQAAERKAGTKANAFFLGGGAGAVGKFVRAEAYTRAIRYSVPRNSGTVPGIPELRICVPGFECFGIVGPRSRLTSQSAHV